MKFINVDQDAQEDIAIIIKNLESHMMTCQYVISKIKESDMSDGLSFSEAHDIISELIHDTEEMADILGEWYEQYGTLDEDYGNLSCSDNLELDSNLIEYLEYDPSDWD